MRARQGGTSGSALSSRGAPRGMPGHASLRAGMGRPVVPPKLRHAGFLIGGAVLPVLWTGRGVLGVHPGGAYRAVTLGQ